MRFIVERALLIDIQLRCSIDSLGMRSQVIMQAEKDQNSKVFTACRAFATFAHSASKVHYILFIYILFFLSCASHSCNISQGVL